MKKSQFQKCLKVKNYNLKKSLLYFFNSHSSLLYVLENLIDSLLDLVLIREIWVDTQEQWTWVNVSIKSPIIIVNLDRWVHLMQRWHILLLYQHSPPPLYSTWPRFYPLPCQLLLPKPIQRTLRHNVQQSPKAKSQGRWIRDWDPIQAQRVGSVGPYSLGSFWFVIVYLTPL